jgi:prepilin-type N-terminal cleavage/methylation domain-containing protein
MAREMASGIFFGGGGGGMKKRGFSLIELLVTLAIMAILAAIAIACYSAFIERVRELCE